MNRRGKTIRLERLRDSSCRLCRLCRSSKHVCIPGKGNVMAPIILMGEAPGAEEGRTGKVFMGRAGKFLDKLLKLLNMLGLVYIINAVRCRPPENREPTQKELDACYYFLRAEISIIRPKIIILMGRVAVTAMGFGTDVNAGSEPFYCGPWPDAWLKATWHPAYCLRRGRAATKDLLKALIWAREKIQ